VTLADGEGGWIDGELLEAPRGVAEVRVLGVRAAPTEPPSPCVLALPPLRSGRVEVVLEKGTELGVTRFVPLHTARARPGSVRTGRWERILRTAAMQCLRSRVPELAAETALGDWLTALPPEGVRWAGRPGGEAPASRPTGPVVLLVGPEGDLTEAEWTQVAAAGFVMVDLGPRRLRTETAALALLVRAAAASAT
jgi:16S rRNA (uracil1498-N3)-methyltransferase